MTGRLTGMRGWLAGMRSQMTGMTGRLAGMTRWLMGMAGMAGLLLGLTACSAADAKKESRDSFLAMDTCFNLTVYGKGGEEALERCREKVRQLEGLWSVTDQDSEIYRLNHGEGESVAVREETAYLVDFALHMAEDTDGALDPAIYPVLQAWGFTTGEYRIPSGEELAGLLALTDYRKVCCGEGIITLEKGMMLDLGSVAKGYAGDLLEELLRSQGIVSALLDLGGNIQTVGAKPDGSPWKLGIQDPFGEGSLGTLQVVDQAVVTSGAYERYFTGEDGKQYGHILDPATGCPAESGLASVTVVAPQGRVCDALSTALYVMGEEKAVRYWHEHGDFGMILVTEGGEVVLSGNLADAFTLSADSGKFSLRIIS